MVNVMEHIRSVVVDCNDLYQLFREKVDYQIQPFIRKVKVTKKRVIDGKHKCTFCNISHLSMN